MPFEALESLLSPTAVDWRRVAEGLVCEYPDGGDYELLREPPEEPRAWLARFERTGERRARFLAALRWWAHAHRVSLTLSANGPGWFEDDGGWIEVDLGAPLTALLGERQPAEALGPFLESSYLEIGEADFARALARGPYVEQPSVDHEAPAEESAAIGLVAYVLGGVLELEAQDLKRATAAGDLDLLREKYPEMALVARLMDRYGEAFSYEVGDDRHFRIEFDVGGEFEIDRLWLSEQLASQEPEALFDQLCDAFDTANQQRSEALERVLSCMAAHGHAVDEEYDAWYFGRTHRELRFDPDEVLSGEGDVRARVSAWLESQGVGEAPDDVRPIERRPLPERPPRTVPALAELDLEAVGRRAGEILARYRRTGPRRPHAAWSSPRWYRADRDGWADEDWWRAQAARQGDDLLLYALGDARAGARIVGRMREVAAQEWSPGFAIYEGLSPLETFLAREQVWPDASPLEFYRATEASGPQYAYWRAFFEELPYEIRRHAAGAFRDGLADPEEPDLEAVNCALRVLAPEELVPFVGERRVAQLRTHCLERATGPFCDYEWERDFLEIAWHMGWEEVLDRLASNERFWQLWLSWPEQLLEAGEFALTLSLFDRAGPARRLAAFVLSLDRDTDEEVSEVLADAGDLFERQRLAAALAWSRFPTAG